MENAISSILLTGLLLFNTGKEPAEIISPIPAKSAQVRTEKIILAAETMDLTKRNPNQAVSGIFRDNILLNLHYINGDADKMRKQPGDIKLYGENQIDWEKVREPFEFSLIVEPGELFAFHDELLPEFKNYKAKTGWTQFSIKEGYKVTGGLSGNGVCHLATLINWVAIEAGLEVTAKVSHDFLPVPGIDRKYGTSIVYRPGQQTTKIQNLYVINTFPHPVIFSFNADNNEVNLSIVKEEEAVN